MGGKWTFERWLLMLGLVGAITSNAVLAGMNWQKFINQAADIETLKRANAELSKSYVPREVYDVNQKNSAESMRQLRESIDDLSQAIRGNTGGGRQSYQRMFDK